jgi:beta-galactosamide-alpha-2,3-sialyltransferase
VSNQNKKNLFLCRTPLQARICLKIIENKIIDDFDFIYFTQNNTNIDREYFSQLEAKSARALYLYVSQKRPDILNHLIGIWKLQRQWRMDDYTGIYLASIDSLVFRYVIKKNPQATLRSFDDGTANITPSSLYYMLGKYKKSNFYGMLMRLPTAEKIKARLQQHYSIYPGFENFIDYRKISFISIFSQIASNTRSAEKGSLTFFIGQPFHEYLDVSQIVTLKTWLAKQHIDFYIMHPRERSPLVTNIPVLDNEGMLAEDAIFKAAGNYRPRIFSSYSTLLFNINQRDADKFYLSIGEGAIEQQRLALISKTGATVLTIT